MTEDAGTRTWEIGQAVSRLGYCLESLGREIRLASADPETTRLKALGAHCRAERDRISRELLEAAMALGGPQDAIEPKELPPPEDGQLIDCPRCGDKHRLMTVQQRGEPPLLFYSCLGRTYLGGVNGRLVTGSVGDGS